MKKNQLLFSQDNKNGVPQFRNLEHKYTLSLMSSPNQLKICVMNMSQTNKKSHFVVITYGRKKGLQRENLY